MPPEFRRDTVKLGNLLSIAEQIQTFGLGRKTGEICIVNAPPPARISILEGEVVDAQFGMLRGREAALALINFPDPESEFAVGEEPQRRTIDLPYMQLLFEAALVGDHASPGTELPPVEPMAPAAADPSLRITLAGAILAFPIPHGVTGIGRAMENEIVLNEPSVSKRHASLEFSGAGIFLRDLDSSNGTYVGGRRIRERWLSARDSVQFGNVHGVFIEGSTSTASAA